MTRPTQIVSVVAALALSVGLVGMARADSVNTHHVTTPRASTPSMMAMDHAAPAGRAPVRVLTKAEVRDIRERGSLPTLVGRVAGPSTITISPNSVPAGRYKIVVHDESPNHNWHIQGRRVDKETTVQGTGRTVFRVRLRPDTYSVRCDVHSTMRTSLTVN